MKKEDTMDNALNKYIVKYSTYYQGKLVGEYTSSELSDKKVCQGKTIIITWDNLEEMYLKYGVILPFNYWNFKKRRRIEFLNFSPLNKNTWTIKEQKNKDLKIIVVITYKKQKIYMRDLLEYDVDTVVQIIKERLQK